MRGRAGNLSDPTVASSPCARMTRKIVKRSTFFALWLGEFIIQPTFALMRVVRGDLSWDINCPIPPAHCMLGLLACSEAYEFGQLGTGLSWFR